MTRPRVEVRVTVGYGRRVEPATDDHAAWVAEQKRRHAVRGADAVQDDDPRWRRLRFASELADRFARRVAEGRPGATVTLNGEPIDRVRDRVRLRTAPDRPDDAARLRFVRRAMKVLGLAGSTHRGEAASALALFRQLVEEAKANLTRADLLNLQDAFDAALATFRRLHGELTRDEMALPE